jgi:hypothetical protein
MYRPIGSASVAGGAGAGLAFTGFDAVASALIALVVAVIGIALVRMSVHRRG